MPPTSSLAAEIVAGGGLTAGEVAKRIPAARGKGRVNPSTVYRWIIQGVRLPGGRLLKLAGCPPRRPLPDDGGCFVRVYQRADVARTRRGALRSASSAATGCGRGCRPATFDARHQVNKDRRAAPVLVH